MLCSSTLWQPPHFWTVSAWSTGIPTTLCALKPAASSAATANVFPMSCISGSSPLPRKSKDYAGRKLHCPGTGTLRALYVGDGAESRRAAGSAWFGVVRVVEQVGGLRPHLHANGLPDAEALDDRR